MGAISPEIAFYVACVEGQHAVTKALIQSGVNVNARMPNGFTPLHAAVCAIFWRREGNITTIQILLQNKVDVEARTQGIYAGHNALHLASMAGRYDFVTLLQDSGMVLESPTISSSDRLPIVLCAVRLA